MYVLWFAMPSVGLAHGGVAEVRLGSDRANPGGGVSIDGDMSAEGPVDLSLVDGSGARRRLAQIAADGQGHFHVVVAMPVDAMPGSYRLEAATGGAVASAVLVIVGAPVAPGDDGAQPRGQDEPVDAAVGGRSVLPGAGSSVRPSIRLAQGPASTSPSAAIDPYPIIASALGLLALGVLLARTGRRPRAR